MEFHHYAASCIGIFLGIFSSTAICQIDKIRSGPATQINFGTKYALLSSDTSNMRLVSDPAGSERTVIELQVRPTDNLTYGALRSEIAANRDYIREGIRWYAMSVYIPGDWQVHPYPTVIAQLLTSQKVTRLSPPVAFVVEGKSLNLELNANHRPIEGVNPATKGNSSHETIRLSDLKTRQWLCFVVRVDWSWQSGQGALRIWMNGDQVYNALNHTNSYETWLGNYAQMGIYMPGMISVNNRKIYVDYIHIGGPRTSLAEISALTPCSGITKGSS